MKRAVETVAGDEDASSTVDMSLSDQIQLAHKGEEITPDLSQQQRLYAIQQKAIQISKLKRSAASQQDQLRLAPDE